MSNDSIGPAGATAAHIPHVGAVPDPQPAAAQEPAGGAAHLAAPIALPVIDPPPAALAGGAAAHAPGPGDPAAVPNPLPAAQAQHHEVVQHVAENPSLLRRVAATLARAGVCLAPGARAVGRVLKAAAKVFVGAVSGLLGGWLAAALATARIVYIRTDDHPRPVRFALAVLWAPMGAVSGVMVGPVRGAAHALEADTLFDMTVGAAATLWTDTDWAALHRPPPDPVPGAGAA